MKRADGRAEPPRRAAALSMLFPVLRAIPGWEDNATSEPDLAPQELPLIPGAEVAVWTNGVGPRCGAVLMTAS